MYVKCKLEYSLQPRDTRAVTGACEVLGKVETPVIAVTNAQMRLQELQRNVFRLQPRRVVLCIGTSNQSVGVGTPHITHTINASTHPFTKRSLLLARVLLKNEDSTTLPFNLINNLLQCNTDIRHSQRKLIPKALTRSKVILKDRVRGIWEGV